MAAERTFIMTLQNFVYNKNTFSKKTWAAIFFGIFFSGGIFGFIYETIFYIINNGALTIRGTCFGPWIEIYGFGGLIIFIISYGLRKKPWLVFLMSGLVCGLLEYAAGFAIYTSTGTRSWDYNTEIWNFGNIGGFICLRSVLVFAFAGLLLMYVIVPVLIWLLEKIGEKRFFILMTAVGLLFLIDILYNDVLAGIAPVTNAIEFYGKSGWYPIVTGYTMR